MQTGSEDARHKETGLSKNRVPVKVLKKSQRSKSQ